MLDKLTAPLTKKSPQETKINNPKIMYNTII
jgi:hypothetical protein